MKKSIQLFVSIIILVLLSTACQSETEGALKPKDVHIYTSIYPIQYITQQLTSQFADVETVYPPGVDAHTYEPSTKDMIDISSSDAFIYLGAGMESFAETTATTLETSDVHFLELGANESLFTQSDAHDEHDDHGHDHGDYDPHIWFDPLRMIHMGNIIKAEMIELFPSEKHSIEEQYTLFVEEMEELDARFVDTLHDKKDKKMIVSHAAYGYWEERYDVEQIPISGISSTQEPSQKELAHLITHANEEQMNYIFFEQNTSNKIAKIIQDHIQATPLYIHNLEVLTDEDIQNQEDYMSLMKKNIQALDEGLQ